MDLPVFIRVISRFKWLFLAGAILASSAGFFSTASVTVGKGKPIFSWRAQEEWSSFSRLLVTSPIIKYGSIGGSASSGSDFEGRARWLATLYASFATSDRVKKIIRSDGPLSDGKDTIDASAISTSSGAVLPIVQLTATSNTAASSRVLADRAAQALRSYVKQQQVATAVPKTARARLVVLNKGGSTKLVAPRSKALPVIAFLSVLFATIALLFAADNMMPAGRRAGDNESLDDTALRVAGRERAEETQRWPSPRAGDVLR